ncbi:peptidase, U32 family [Clostridiales bacterium oral taxon 876 str. F0540]|nr:peptidase, U32 family [Clostridiales bacterium oral taxon 876 str. F0540]
MFRLKGEKMNKIELLAPSGSMDSLYAAVQSGADAVYLGGSKFSARAYASNFDEENMEKAIDYCHLNGVKVYITINTLIKQSEIKEAIEYVRFLYESGVDALIIQDIGLASLIRNNFPDLEIHASTQMTIHNGEGALFLKRAGFKRIVLSRELSVEEVKHISEELGVETEIFIHGALCICYSGQCLMSSMIWGRSGNRGRCAQPCRLPYTLIDRNNNKERSAYILSPKDICTLEDIEKIIQSSTSSLKIEGRMKRPEYVAGVVDVYRRAIDSIYEKKNFNFEEENKKLLKLFNREGFSKAYFFGNKGKDMMAYNFPKNTGIILGKALKNSNVELEEAVAVGDGIRTGDDGFIVNKIIKDGMEINEAYKGDRVKLLPSKYKLGEELYKTSDTKLLKELEGYYSNINERKINLEAVVDFKVNENFTIKTIYDDKEFIASGDIVQQALKKPVELDKLKENLKKSGDTPLRFKNIEVKSFEDGFLPVSAINSARRELIEKIENYIISKAKREFSKDISYNISEGKENKLPEILIIASTEEQAMAVKESNISAAVAIDIFKKQSSLSIDDMKKFENLDIYLKVPNIIKEEFNHICSTIDKLIPHIKGIVTANLGIINKYNSKLTIIGDYKLNIFNSYSADFYGSYISGASLSVELNKKEIAQVIKGSRLPFHIKIYGKEELMISEYCPVGSVFGGKSSCSSCSENCKIGDYILKDRKGENFPLRTDKFCRSYIYNTFSTNLIPNLKEIKESNLRSFRIDLIDESYEDTLNVLNFYKKEEWQGEYVNFTRGHYKRGVE